MPSFESEKLISHSKDDENEHDALMNSNVVDLSSSPSEDSFDEDDESIPVKRLLNNPSNIKYSTLHNKHRQNIKQKRRSHIHRGAKRFVRLLICLLLMPVTLLTLYLPLYSNIQVRQAELPDWDLNTSRHILDYMLPKNDTTLLEPRLLYQKQDKVFVLIMVSSNIENFVARQTIRQTWGNTTEFNYQMFSQMHSHLKGQYLEASKARIQYYSEFLNLSPNATSITDIKIPVRVVFLIGRKKSDDVVNNELLNMKIRNESEHYEDIIQEDFIDTYNNLTLKSVLALKWVKRNYLQNCAFFMKCDDDTFVNIPNLLHYLLGGTIPLYNYTIDLYNMRTSKVLSSINRLNITQNYLAGHLFCTVQPISDVNSKWYMPYYMYPENTYPKYLSGAGYIMTIDVVPKIYNAALNTSLVYLEDIFITGLCAEKAGIKRIHHALFEYMRIHELCSFKGTITQHYMKDNLLTEAYAFVTDLTKRCSPPSQFYKHMPFRKMSSCV